MHTIILALVLAICTIALGEYVRYLLNDHSEPKYDRGYVPSNLLYLEKLFSNFEESYEDYIHNKAEVGDNSEISDDTVANYYS